ncbi:universal stress protein [Ilumatobacter sp.]|uniref:universal stress protein n=1 Tax=Ilumatobacter sp. TaxID=1967498 RepID=UPI003C34C49F
MSNTQVDAARTTRWMVGVDGSQDAAVALRWAAGMAAASSSEIVPVCAWNVPLPTFALAGRRAIDVDRAGLRATAEVGAAQSIDAASDSDSEEVLIGELLTVEGHPSDVLLDLTGAGTTVVTGRRGIGQIRRRVLGSVSRDLATHCEGPVVIVPAGWDRRPCRTIVVGFDGSEHAQAALAWALANAPEDATVRALIAIDVVPWLQPELVLERHSDYVEEERARIAAAIDAVDPDQRAERVVVLHGPRQALAEAMDEADLIVVGPRGIGAVSRTMLGSVTTWILEAALCPIAVVPR